MLSRYFLSSLRRQTLPVLRATNRSYQMSSISPQRILSCLKSPRASAQLPIIYRKRFHASSRLTAQSPSADVLMENLNDLYATAKDEFEIAAEETEKKTVYASEDREAAKAALDVLKKAFEKALKESDPEVAKEVQGRVGNRIRELENAITAMEEMAMED